MKVVIPSNNCREKIWFLRSYMMSFAFMHVIFGEKGLEIDTYKYPKCIWSYIFMFVSIWNHPEHIIYVFRHFWLHFMLCLCSKLLKNVNFGFLDRCGQRVLTACVWYDQISWSEMENSSWGVEKNIFFSYNLLME